MKQKCETIINKILKLILSLFQAVCIVLPAFIMRDLLIYILEKNNINSEPIIIEIRGLIIIAFIFLMASTFLIWAINTLRRAALNVNKVNNKQS